MTWERELYDAPHYAQPTSIDTFYNEPLDTPPPRQPIIVLACGSDLHVFKRRKPLTVVRVPDVPVDEAEREVWTRFVDGRMGGGTGGERDGSVGKLVEALRVLAQREGGIRLSSRTREVLAAASARDDELVRVLCEYFKDHYAAYRQSVSL